MRKFEKNKNISVHAVAGSYVVVLGMDATAKGVKWLLGFAIHRTDHTEDEAYWLKGFLTFEETDEGRDAGGPANILENPVQDETVAQTYLDYWEAISQNPSAKKFRPWNDSHTPVNNPGPKTQVIFSPRGSLEALENYATIMSKAKSSVFLTAAFGVSTQLAEKFFVEKGYLRYLLLESKGRGRSVDYVNKISENEYNRIALGAIIESNELENWHQENLTNLNSHVRYIHTKYMLVDPLSDNPITITGSANFSEASTISNDENMLIIRGNKRVADIYIGEYMRLFKHFYFRNKINQAKYKNESTGDSKPRKKYLKSSDCWTKKYYVKNSVMEKERLLFNGKRS